MSLSYLIFCRPLATSLPLGLHSILSTFAFVFFFFLSIYSTDSFCCRLHERIGIYPVVVLAIHFFFLLVIRTICTISLFLVSFPTVFNYLAVSLVLVFYLYLVGNWVNSVSSCPFSCVLGIVSPAKTANNKNFFQQAYHFLILLFSSVWRTFPHQYVSVRENCFYQLLKSTTCISIHFLSPQPFQSNVASLWVV